MKRKVVPILMFIALHLLTGCVDINAAPGSLGNSPRHEPSSPDPAIEMSQSPSPEQDYLQEENFIPNNFVPLAELEEEYGYDLRELFPDFEVSETLEGDTQGYRFDLPDRETYLLVDGTQTKLSVMCGGRSAAFSIPRIFPSSVDGPVTLFVRDVTGDGTDEVVYLSHYTGTGQSMPFVHILDLTTLEEYPVDYEQSVSNLKNQVTIIPRKSKDNVVVCDVELSETTLINAEIRCETLPTLDTKAEVFCGDLILLDWERKSQALILDVALSIPEGMPGQYLCSIRSPLTFDDTMGTFIAQGPYTLQD